MAFESARKILDTAKELRLTADAADQRLTEMLQAGYVSDAEFLKMNAQVDKLYSAVRDLTTHAEDIIISDMDLTQQRLVNTINGAKDEIKKISDARKLFKVLASLIGFAAVAMGGQPVAIVGALEGVRKAVA